MYVQDTELSQLKATLHSLQHQATQDFDERSLRRQHSFNAPSLSGRQLYSNNNNNNDMI